MALKSRAFATAPGDVAADGTGSNGTYTKYLVRALTQRGQKIEDMFKQVRDERGGDQVPWENSSLMGDLLSFPSQRGQTRKGPVEPGLIKVW